MSIQALADSLGISISTVSRALNGYTDVSAATRQRVFDAAKAMNYLPHPVAHRLATGKTGAVAIVNTLRTAKAVDGSGAALHTGIAQELRKHNYFALSLTLPTGDDELPELERVLGGRLVDAFVLTRTRTFDSRVKLLQEKKIPFVTHGRTIDNEPHAWVDVDNEGALERVTTTLIGLGHRRIAFINGMVHMSFASLREQGFRAAIQQAGLAEQECPVHYTELTAESGLHVALQLLATQHHPTAFVCATDAVALGVMAAVRQSRRVVGQDISVFGYGNTEAGRFAEPPLASVDQAIVNEGCLVAQQLMRVLAGEPVKATQVIEPAQLLMRASVGNAAS